MRLTDLVINYRPQPGDLLIKKFRGKTVEVHFIMNSVEYDKAIQKIDFAYYGIAHKIGLRPEKGLHTLREYYTTDSNTTQPEYELVKAKRNDT